MCHDVMLGVCMRVPAKAFDSQLAGMAVSNVFVAKIEGDASKPFEKRGSIR